MKIFLLIPALLLFLSNIPFKREMNMEEVMASREEKGSCNKQVSLKGSCQKAEQEEENEASDCSKPQPCESKTDSDSPDMPCKKPETTCVCFCCFQYASPSQIAAKFEFNKPTTDITHNILAEADWKNPLLKLPWQPPDLA